MADGASATSAIPISAAPNGGLLGGPAGYNYQVGQFVGGVEADLDWTDMNKSNVYALGTNKFSTSTMTTERLRAGIALDRTLLFVTGGYAGIETKGSFNDTLNLISGSQSTWRNGGVIGGGVEYAFTNNITAKAEYLYMPTVGRELFRRHARRREEQPRHQRDPRRPELQVLSL